MKARVVGLPDGQTQVTMDDGALSALIAPNQRSYNPTETEVRRRFGVELRDALVHAALGGDVSLDDVEIRRAVKAAEDAAR